ncbi:hypothetical protein [Paenibacillus sp. 481]|uniref:hypothetical protein n=1 Tax=Paenibacillus sp. 481 TaxID=2835869 RepID=UPI001E4871B5|nr:hypothetical protein [Paenibacillus sp. 481]UHA74588.1 hypothetical protein KIK04_05715 [Paenibacillus sp. 481]
MQQQRGHEQEQQMDSESWNPARLSSIRFRVVTPIFILAAIVCVPVMDVSHLTCRRDSVVWLT